MTRVKHLMTKFISEDQLPVASSFGEFADKIVAGWKLHDLTQFLDEISGWQTQHMRG